ncbi:hypothetical protein BH23GEM3_BH23GEM3_06000 [soil metagenome]
MSEGAGEDDLRIIGAGRVGLALGLLLQRAGAARSLTFVGRRSTAPDHPLFAGGGYVASYHAGLPPAAPPPTGVLLAVQDAALPEAVRALARERLPAGTPVLHLSGALGADLLQPLAERGCSVGSLHPLAAIADSVEGAERLRDVWWGVEAAGEAGELAGRIVAAASGRILTITPGGKPLYHAAAVFASNYVVALLATAEQAMGRAGAPLPEARAALAALASGAVHNVAVSDPCAALTGPVARGDADTVALHLAHLSDAERALYSPLTRAALELARVRGVDVADARRIEHLLEDKG